MDIPRRRASHRRYALEALPQQDYAHPVGDLPAWPVDAVCAALAQAATDEELIAAAAKWSKLALGAPASGCWPTLDEGPGGVPGDGPGPGAWGYQSCTETLHQFSSDSAVRDYEFNLTAQSDLCFKLYGVRPDPTKLARLFGGYAIPGNVTNVVFSNGLRDPWSGGGFYAAAPSEAHASNASFRRADLPLTNRGDAAAATWTFRGGCVAATPRPRRGYSVERRASGSASCRPERITQTCGHRWTTTPTT